MTPPELHPDPATLIAGDAGQPLEPGTDLPDTAPVIPISDDAEAVAAAASATNAGPGPQARRGVVGYAPGVFDMFHIGHLKLLRHAREHCDHLIVGVVTDEVVRAAKGHDPAVPLAERMTIVEQFDVVDEVVVDVSTDKFEMWKLLAYDVLFKGDDWRGTERAERLERLLGEVGARLQYFPYTTTTSSTKIRRQLEGA